MAEPDRRNEDQPPRWGYAAAIIVSAAAHIGIALFLLFVLPRLWRQQVVPEVNYTVKVVDNIPAGDLGTRLPRLNDERQQADEEPPPPEERHHEEQQPPEVKAQPAPTAPPVENDKNAIALNSTPVATRTPTPTPPPPTPAPTATPVPAVEATVAPTAPPTAEPTPEPTLKPTPRATPRPHHTPRPRPTPRPAPRATPRPRPSARPTPRPTPRPRPTPEAVRHHPPAVMIAKEEPTPSVKQQMEKLREDLLKQHLKDIADREKARERAASENPGEGPVVAGRATSGHGYGVGSGTGSAGIEQDAEFLLYYKDVQDKIKESWYFAGGNPNLTATVVFGINPDGSLNELKVVNGSGDSAFDNSVMRAIKRAAPFLPPPDKYRSQFAGGVTASFKLSQLKS